MNLKRNSVSKIVASPQKTAIVFIGLGYPENLPTDSFKIYKSLNADV